MKKLFLVALILALCMVQPVFAGTRTSTLIDAVTITDDPMGATSDSIRMYPKLAFLIEYDETEVSNAVSGIVTYEVSFDNSTWVAGSWYDVEGGITLDTVEIFVEDTNYYMWVDDKAIAPYYRVGITAVNTDSDDTIVVTITSVTKE